ISKKSFVVKPPSPHFLHHLIFFFEITGSVIVDESATRNFNYKSGTGKRQQFFIIARGLAFERTPCFANSCLLFGALNVIISQFLLPHHLEQLSDDKLQKTRKGKK
ncbi:MAG: hypothetical protein ACQEQN_05565, partial [Thermodesulfobacteriota bacterium]